MTAVHRTFINRGKHEIKEIKPNFVYAVEYTLPTETARTLGIRTEQVGLIVTNHYGSITHSYNIQSIGAWAIGPIDVSDKHMWYAAPMEISFATAHIECESLNDKVKTLRSMYAKRHSVALYYESHPLHQAAERIIELWNKLMRRA